jgi:hypothetical protein
MRLKYVLTTATAALFITGSALAQTQQTPSGADRGKAGAQSETAPSGSATPSGAMGSTSLEQGALHEVDDDKAMVQRLNVSAKDLGDMDIYGSDGKKIGGVGKVLADSSNTVKAVTVDVGGFLGIGTRQVVLPLDKLQKGTEKDRLQTTMTKAEIEKLGEWTDRKDATGRRATPDSPARTSPNAPARSPDAPRTAPPPTTR